jgi:hypothetical protein
VLGPRHEPDPVERLAALPRAAASFFSPR